MSIGKIELMIEIDAPPSACYRMWKDFERFPHFMGQIKKILPLPTPHTWRWEVIGPLGKILVWDIMIDAMAPDRMVSWHSIGHGSIETTGSAEFFPIGTNQTQMALSLTYMVHTAPLVGFWNERTGMPQKSVKENMIKFKSRVERRYRWVRPFEQPRASEYNPREIPFPGQTDMDIGKEYTMFGVTKYPEEAEKETHQLEP